MAHCDAWRTACARVTLPLCCRPLCPKLAGIHAAHTRCAHAPPLLHANRAPLAMTDKMKELLARMGQARRNDKMVNARRNSPLRPASTSPRFAVTRRGLREGADPSASSDTGSGGARRSKEASDEVTATATALEVECRQLMAQDEVADFVKSARLSESQVLLSFLEGTRQVRSRLAL